jgi:hypothetical protein
MSKKFKDFQARWDTPQGNLDTIQKNYITRLWPNIEYCIQNRLPLYFMALTQSGKTFLKLELALRALRSGLIDNVIINSTNLVGANRQLLARAKTWAWANIVSVKDTADKNAFMLPGDVFINMSNAGKLNRIDAIVNQAEAEARKYKRAAPRILVINDEGEEFHELTETSQCDTALGNLLVNGNHNIVVAKVSATLLSHLLVHGPYSSELGYLDHRQVYKLPIHPDYRGLSVPHFIEPVLEDESNFNDGGYTNSANLRNTRNIRIIANKIEDLIQGQAHYGDSKLTRLLPQIGNVVLGNSRAGHQRAAAMLTRAFQLVGRSTVVWDAQDFDQLNTQANVVVIVHNGTSSQGLSVADRLSLIAHRWDRTRLKAVIIISKKMIGKSITVECENHRDIASPEFGFYANFTAYYGKKGENITLPIQAMRCTGIRADIKPHVMWTTEEIKMEIENYHDQIDSFVSHINSVGVLSTTQLINWNQKRPIAKAKVQRKLGAVSGTTRSDSNVIDNTERHISTEADVIIPVTNAEYKQLGLDKQAILDFVMLKGFAPASTDVDDWEQIRQDRVYANGNGARNAFKNHNKGKKVKAHWVKQTRGWLLYVKNNMITMPRVEYVAHELDSTGRPTFATSRFYTGANNSAYTYKVA